MPPKSDQHSPIIDHALLKHDCLLLVLSRPFRGSGDHEAERMTVRPVELRGEATYQIAMKYGTKERHENLRPRQARDRVLAALGSIYSDCHLYTASKDYSIRLRRSGTARIRTSPPSKAPDSQSHNRQRNYLIPEGQPCGFLEEIGVMTPSGQVRASKQHKFRQINRFLEIVQDILRYLPDEGPLHVVDYGCGKSYLTFALHSLLTERAGRKVQIVGLDRNQEVIDECRRVTAKLELRGLRFEVGDIASHQPAGAVHLAVSLHACDTATDDALAGAVRWQCPVILSVPCCQHELAGQLESEELAPLLQHGILREKFGSLATDSLRAAALELCGYRTNVLEFIDLEHTPKNLLIRAVRREADAGPDHQTRRITRYTAMKRLLSLKTTHLEQALGDLLPELPDDAPQG